MPISLPSNANVGHLKKQAKQLLKACRNDQPEAKRRFVANHPDYASGIADSSTVKLQEAQLVIAKEYGAASWVKLLELTGGESEIESDDSGVLLMTNGTMAVQRLEAAGVPGHKEEWLEALCDGPAPLTESRRAFNQIRAATLNASAGPVMTAQ